MKIQLRDWLGTDRLTVSYGVARFAGQRINA